MLAFRSSLQVLRVLGIDVMLDAKMKPYLIEVGLADKTKHTSNASATPVSHTS